MIPAMHIVAWGRTVPWAEARQVEQDLIIGRAIVAIFGDPYLAQELRFRGGTALNKLHFPSPLRYSEDIEGGPKITADTEVRPPICIQHLWRAGLCPGRRVSIAQI